MSKPVIKITLRKIFRCSNDFSWLMTGQTHLLYSDLPKAPGLPQGLSTNRIIGIIYTTHKLINDHPSKEVKCRKPIYLYTNQIHMTLPSKTLIWWIRRQKDKRDKRGKKQEKHDWVFNSTFQAACVTQHPQFLRCLDITIHCCKAPLHWLVWNMSFNRLWNLIYKHCQRHNGPEGWVVLNKLTSLGHITSSYTNLQNLDQPPTSKSQPNISISTKLKLKNFDQT